MLRRMLKRLGLLAFSAMFLRGGYQQFKDPGPRSQQAIKAGVPASQTFVQASGLVMIAAGLLLQVDPLRRVAAWILALQLPPITYVGHRFWEAEGQARAMQTVQFFKNLTMFGGALYIASDR